MKNNRLKNIIIYFLSFVSSAVGIFLNFFLAKVLGAGEFGRIQYLIALSNTSAQVMIFGLNNFLIKEAKNVDQDGQIFNKCFSLYLCIVIFTFPIFYFVLYNYASGLMNSWFLTIVVLIIGILIGSNSLIAAFFQGNGKYHLTIIFENLIPKAAMLFVSIMLLLIMKSQNFNALYLVFYIVVYFLATIPFIVINFRKINLKFKKEEIITIVFFFGITLTYSLGNNLTKVLQGGLYKNDVALAIISVSLSIVSLVKVFTGVLDSMVKPIFAKKKRENDFTGVIGMYRFDTRMNSYVIIPLYIFFCMHSNRFLSLFGTDFMTYPSILLIISLANCIGDITGPNGTMLAMTGKEKWELFNGILYFGFYLACTFIFSFDKVYGLSWALFVATVAVNVAKYIEVWIFYKSPPLDIKTIISLALIVFVNSIIIFLLKFLSFDNFIWFLIGIGVGVVLVFFNCFVLSLRGGSDFKQMLSLKL